MSFSVSAGKRKPNWFLRNQQLNSKPESEPETKPETEPEMVHVPEPIIPDEKLSKDNILVTNLKLELKKIRQKNLNLQTHMDDLISSNQQSKSLLEIKDKEIEELKNELYAIRLEIDSLRNVVPIDKSESESESENESENEEDEDDEDDVGGGLELHPRLASF